MDKDTTLPIAVQLPTLRTLSSGLDDTLAQVAAAGFRASPPMRCVLLEKHGLRVISIHLQLDALREHTREIIAFNQAIGNNTLVVPYIVALRGESRAIVSQETGRLLGELA